MSAGFVSLELDDWQPIWRKCWSQIRIWRLPPGWNRSDWADEAQSTGILAAMNSLKEYDPNRNVPLEAFLFLKVRAAVWTLYRREWSLCRRFHELNLSCDRGNLPVPAAPTDLTEHLLKLSDEDRQLIELIYWQGHSEAEIATRSGVTRQAINKRKQAILHRLKELQS